MFWTGFVIGLFVGANVGVVIGGMLFLAKASDKAIAKLQIRTPSTGEPNFSISAK